MEQGGGTVPALNGGALTCEPYTWFQDISLSWAGKHGLGAKVVN